MFNLTPNSGEGFVPYVKYNAKAGRWYYRRDGEAQDIELVSPQFAIDMRGITTGWIFYAAGSAPVRVPDPGPGCQADKPQGNLPYKRGFWVSVWNQETGVRELSSCAAAMIGPMSEMYQRYESDRASYPGQVPVFRCSRVVPVKGKKDTNYQPVFELVNWVQPTMFPAPRSQPAAPAQAPRQGNGQPPPDAATSELARVWKVYCSKASPGSTPDMLKIGFKTDCQMYFGDDFDRARVTAQEWAQFASDNFTRPANVLPPGRDDSDIPF